PELLLRLEVIVLAVAAEEQPEQDHQQREAGEDEPDLVDRLHRAHRRTPVLGACELRLTAKPIRMLTVTRIRASTAAASPVSLPSSRPTSRITPAKIQTRPITAAAVTPSAALRFDAAIAWWRLRAAIVMPRRPATQATPVTAQ